MNLYRFLATVWPMLCSAPALWLTIRFARRRKYYQAASQPLAFFFFAVAPLIGMALGAADDAPDGYLPYVTLAAAVACFGLLVLLFGYEAQVGRPWLFWVGTIGLMLAFLMAFGVVAEPVGAAGAGLFLVALVVSVPRALWRLGAGLRLSAQPS